MPCLQALSKDYSCRYISKILFKILKKKTIKQEKGNVPAKKNLACMCLQAISKKCAFNNIFSLYCNCLQEQINESISVRNILLVCCKSLQAGTKGTQKLVEANIIDVVPAGIHWWISPYKHCKYNLKQAQLAANSLHRQTNANKLIS